jgi:cell division protein FtsI (penicillin-binding protein 3)
VRNRAFTDLFEPGSTMKPFTVLTALMSGRFRPETVVDTAPGSYRVGRNTVRDVRNFGRIDVARVITKSSNVGAAKLALAMPAETLAQTYQRVGFGTPTMAGFPGEGSGQLRPWREWRRVEQATLAFGYGLSVTAVQLARAYSVLATGGVLRPLTLVARDKVPDGERVFPEGPVREVRAMLETVVGREGTAQKAQVPRYRVGGKTGTVRKAIAGGYSRQDYLALFAGMAPISRPRLVLVVVIHEPRGKSYYGGQVAAPVFARVMEAALRLLNVPPDQVSPLQIASPPTVEART